VGNLRPAILYLAALLILLSIQPLRRKLPLLRAIRVEVELLVWLGFGLFCLAALASVQTRRSIELGLAIGRAALYFALQAFELLLGSMSAWASAHEQVVVEAIVGIALLSWFAIFARATAAFRRALQPSPRLGDWWLLKLPAAPRAQARLAPSSKLAEFVDARAAALYLGVPSATVYRWARTGRLASRRARGRLHFNSLDLAKLRETDSAQQHVASASVAQ
jgi:hypothetical protein